MKSLTAAVAMCLLLSSPVASEILEVDFRVPGDALLTRDTATGLEWLDLTPTRGRSFQEVSSQFGLGGQYEGFRHATKAEVVTFWRNVGLVDIDLPGYLNYTAANFAGAVRLGQWVGFVGAVPGTEGFTLISGISSTPASAFPSGLLLAPRIEIYNGKAEARTNPQIAFFYSLADTGNWIVRPAPLTVDMDVRPDSCPNRLNPKAHGVLPVAIWGTESFFPESLDLSTLELSRADGVGSAVRPLLGPPGPGPEVEDVGGPAQSCDLQENGDVDGILDLALKFSLPELASALRLDETTEGQVELILRGKLLDNSRIEARDTIVLTR